MEVEGSNPSGPPPETVSPTTKKETITLPVIGEVPIKTTHQIDQIPASSVKKSDEMEKLADVAVEGVSSAVETYKNMALSIYQIYQQSLEPGELSSSPRKSVYSVYEGPAQKDVSVAKIEDVEGLEPIEMRRFDLGEGTVESENPEMVQTVKKIQKGSPRVYYFCMRRLERLD